MPVSESRARYSPQVGDVVLRNFEDGAETPYRAEGQILEPPIARYPRFQTGLVLAVLHVARLEWEGGGSVWIDIISGAQSWIGEDQSLLVRVPVYSVGQRTVGFGCECIPAHHVAIACRCLRLEGEGPALLSYGLWLRASHP